MRNTILYNLFMVTIIAIFICAGCFLFGYSVLKINAQHVAHPAYPSESWVEHPETFGDKHSSIVNDHLGFDSDKWRGVTNSIDDPRKDIPKNYPEKEPFWMALLTALGILLVAMVVRLASHIDKLFQVFVVKLEKLIPGGKARTDVES